MRIAKAQLVAERLTLSAAQRLFDTAGASATSHSPLAYKAHVTGNYLVNGTWPPANGYF